MLRKLPLVLGMAFSASSLALAAQQAGVAGRWSSTIGTEPVVYTVTVTGDALSGSMLVTNYDFSAPLSGTVKGDSVFFEADVPDNKVGHRGKVVGDTLFMVVTGSSGPTEVKAVRAR
jgi:hypothetical protein